MKRLLVPAVLGAFLVVVAVAGAATVVSASSPTDLFASCVADNVSAQQSELGSTLYPNSEVEPRSAINPLNRLNIVGEYQQDRWNDGGARGLVASVTHDGGATWTQVKPPGLTKCQGGVFDRASDPWVAFATNGDLYAISLSFDAFDTHNAILVSKSTNGGDTWSPAKAIAEDYTNGLDKESITTDPHDASTVYAAWDRLITPGGSTRSSDQGIRRSSSYKSQTYFSKSSDGGATWTAPRQIFTTASYSGSIGSIIRVLPDGTLLDTLLTYGNGSWKGGPCGTMSVLRSTDGGASWSQKPTVVSPVTCTYTGAHDPAPIRSGGLPDVATDGSNVYVVWEDGALPSGTTGRIWFSASSDGGLTFGPPTEIDKTPPTADAFVPTIAVNAAHTIGVSYYDLRNNSPATAAAETDVWLVKCSSACGSGSSWSETHVAGSFDMHQAPYARGEFVGDYQGMTTDGNVFQPFFVQAINQSTNPTDAYFTNVP